MIQIDWDSIALSNSKCTLSTDGAAYYENLKAHKNENFFGFDFEFCTISLLVMYK
jgi:hypothetical protein